MTQEWSVWLYGSAARGDVDGLSDFDVLLVGPPGEEPEGVLVAAGLCGKDVSISRYSWDEVQGMAEYGSLFLHHVRLEGHPLYEGESCRGRLRTLIAQLGEYTLAKRDILGFKVVLADVAESLEQGGSKAFELSVLATVIRHASILGCWLIGAPKFGRLAPVAYFSCTICESATLRDFEHLYMYRLYCDGRLERGALRPVAVGTWLDRAQRLVGALEEVLNEKHCKVPS